MSRSSWIHRPSHRRLPVFAVATIAWMVTLGAPSVIAATHSGAPTPAAMTGMDMQDDALLGMLLIDQLEATHDRDGNGQAWQAEGWYGNDRDKLWVRSEGDRAHGSTGYGDFEVLWNRSATTYWNTQLGVRHDFGTGPSREWAAFGVQGLAPYFFDVEATAYVGPAGRTAARLRIQYDLLFTQRLILRPEIEANLYGKSDPRRRIGTGLSDGSLGLRLRYEIRREFAPYVGALAIRRFGATAGWARAEHHPTSDLQWVAGVRFWF